MAKNLVAADDGLIELAKDGETIRAHPCQVPLWKKQGWVETEAAEEEPLDNEDDLGECFTWQGGDVNGALLDLITPLQVAQPAVKAKGGKAR